MVFNPLREEKYAKRILKMEYEGKKGDIDIGTFIRIFAEMEIYLREISDKYFESTHNAPSLSEVIKSLLTHEIIRYDLYENLQKIRQYRNLVAHGHENKVNSDMVTLLKDAYDRVKIIDDSHLSSA